MGSLKTATKYQCMQEIKVSLQIMAKKPMQTQTKVFRTVQNLTVFFS